MKTHRERGPFLAGLTTVARLDTVRLHFPERSSNSKQHRPLQNILKEWQAHQLWVGESEMVQEGQEDAVAPVIDSVQSSLSITTDEGHKDTIEAE